MKDPITG